MGDRTYCSLYVYGTVTQAQLETLGQTHGAQDVVENFLGFDEVNRGEMSSDLFSALEALNLSWAWHWNDGDEYGAGVLFYDAETKNTAEFDTRDMEIVLSLREMDNPESIAKAREWEAWSKAKRCTMIEVAA